MVEIRAVPSVEITLCEPALTPPPVADTTLRRTTIDLRGQMLERFLNDRASKLNTRKSYYREVTRFLDWLPRRTLQEIRLSDFINFKVWLKGEPHYLSPNSVNSALTALKSFFGWLVEARELKADPTDGCHFEKAGEPDPQDISEETLSRIWEVVLAKPKNQLRNMALLHVLIHGLRAGEVASLRLASLDLEKATLFVAATKTGDDRLVPLRPESVAQIDAYLQWRARRGEALTYDRPLFLSSQPRNQDGGLSYSGIFQVIETISHQVFPEKNEAGDYIKTLHPHQFRHTSACEMLMMGLDPGDVKAILGHSSDAMLKRYSKRVRKKAAVKSFHRLLEDHPDGQLPLATVSVPAGTDRSPEASWDRVADEEPAPADGVGTAFQLPPPA